MAAFVQILGQFFALAVSFIQYLERKQLIETSRAQAELNHMKVKLDAVRIAIAARETVRSDIAKHPDSVPDDDPFLRD